MIFSARSFFYQDSNSPFETGVINCGHQLVRTQDYRWDGMHRGSRVLYVWQYTLSGRGAILLNGEKHDLPPGTAFFVRIPHEHVYYLPEDSSSWEFLYLTLYGSEMDRIGSEFIHRYGNILKHQKLSRAVMIVRELLQYNVSRTADDRYLFALFAYEFLVSLFREHEYSGCMTPGMMLIEKVNLYLQEHLSQPLRISTLAAACGCSRSHFSRLFHAASGKTPQVYLQEMRLRLALRLLQTERKSIKETAMNAGFEDPSYFCRVFHRKFGMTPEQFRSGKKAVESGK